MLPLIMAACGAVGAVVGVVTTQTAKEQDRQAIKRYEKVNAELIDSRDRLQQRYYELADRSKQQINELNLKLVESEMEKDVVYLALELYQELMGLREDIDINPSFEVLVEFHKAIILTNYVLKQLNRRLVPVTQDYFKRTLTRIDERDDLGKEQLFSFMSVLMNPQEDTVSSLLGEVQNKIFSQKYTEVEEGDANSFVEKESSTELIKVIDCPSCKRKNYITDNISSTNCPFCGCHINLISRQHETTLEEVSQIQQEIWLKQAVAAEEARRAAEEARRAAEEAVASDFWCQKSLATYNSKRYRDSLYFADKAIALNPTNDWFWYRKSQALYRLDRKKEALNALDKAIAINPNYKTYRYFRKNLLE